MTGILWFAVPGKPIRAAFMGLLFVIAPIAMLLLAAIILATGWQPSIGEAVVFAAIVLVTVALAVFVLEHRR